MITVLGPAMAPSTCPGPHTMITIVSVPER